MVKAIELTLTTQQREELEQVRDYSGVPHLREKAAALLKIADGQSALQVATHGLLRKRKSDTVYEWVTRYRSEGIAGLKVRKGRGRKAAFSPSLRQRRASQRSTAEGGTA